MRYNDASKRIIFLTIANLPILIEEFEKSLEAKQLKIHVKKTKRMCVCQEKWR